MYAGLILYFSNYAIGWMLFTGKLSVTKRSHQAIYSVLIAALAVNAYFSLGDITRLVLILSSLAMMLILPLGIKGGYYHRIVSSLGLMLYIIYVFI